ncbi:unnamed protein product, partial [Rotaria socialis]
QTTATIEPYTFRIFKKINDPLQVAFVRCEALRIHGYHGEVFKLAKQLADYMLNNDEYSSSSQELFQWFIFE